MWVHYSLLHCWELITLPEFRKHLIRNGEQQWTWKWSQYVKVKVYTRTNKKCCIGMKYNQMHPNNSKRNKKNSKKRQTFCCVVRQSVRKSRFTYFYMRFMCFTYVFFIMCIYGLFFTKSNVPYRNMSHFYVFYGSFMQYIGIFLCNVPFRCTSVLNNIPLWYLFQIDHILNTFRWNKGSFVWCFDVCLSVRQWELI